MSKQRTATKNHTRISYVHRGVGSVVLRRFDSACDSFDELTQMLHRSFARLGGMGLNCTCVDQSALVTRARAMGGDCYVAVCNGRLVGTMTLYTQDTESVCALYRRDDIASVRQIGVDPAYQSRGIGKSLLAYADHWAAIRGYAELALDTPCRGSSFSGHRFGVKRRSQTGVVDVEENRCKRGCATGAGRSA
jgi:GNAT superfamily N-acetyltransferase